MSEFYGNIWELYGLKSNPFFTDPLLIFGGSIDLKIGFVGREEELRRLQNVIYSAGGSRVLVSGDVGVGKTTFVNYVRAVASQNNFFTTLKEIAVQPEWSGLDFMMNTLAAIYHTIKVRTDLNEEILSKETFRKLQLLVDIVEKKDREFGLNILAIGGNMGSSTNISIPSPNVHSIQVFFEQIVSEIREAEYKELIFHYNNLEVLEPEELKKLFNSIRDFIQTKDVNFIFIGDLTVPQTLNQIRRVSSIMSETPIILGSLNIKEIKQLLEKRIKQLEVPGLTAVKPYDDEVISKLYNLYDGNLRFILNSISTVFCELVKDNPIIITNKELVKVLAETGKKRWLDKLTDSEKEVLFLILKEEEITNKKIASMLKKKRQNISKLTNKLLELCAIKIKRIDGKEKFFSVVHSIKWFLLEEEANKLSSKQNNVSKEIQKALEL